MTKCPRCCKSIKAEEGTALLSKEYVHIWCRTGEESLEQMLGCRLEELNCWGCDTPLSNIAHYCEECKVWVCEGWCKELHITYCNPDNYASVVRGAKAAL